METKQTELFTVKINSASSRSTIPINFTFPSLSPASDQQLVATNYTLKSFKCKSIIQSLAAVPFPDIPLTASQTEALVQTLNLEWTNSRIQLDVMLQDSSNDWNSIGALSLLNISPYPYRNFDLLTLITNNTEFSCNNGNLGILISDVGYGFLGTNDSVVVWCEVEQNSYFHTISQPATTNITVPTPTINLNVTGSISSGGGASYGSIGNCSGVTPTVSGSGQWYQFTAPVTNQLFQVTVAPGVPITNTSDAICVNSWNIEPTNSFNGKNDPPITTLNYLGGNFEITSDITNQWFTIGVRDSNDSNNYHIGFFTVTGNQITIVGV